MYNNIFCIKVMIHFSLMIFFIGFYKSKNNYCKFVDLCKSKEDELLHFKGLTEEATIFRAY
jgi:hypothetical protein